jgi:UDP-glucose:(heptosyl)LPS alpha-1,3-glucosyltransferase
LNILLQEINMPLVVGTYLHVDKLTVPAMAHPLKLPKSLTLCGVFSESTDLSFSEPLPPKPLRIAVISRHFTRYLGGAENYAVSLVEQLAPRHDITVFCQSYASELAGVRYVALGWQLKRLRWLNLWIFALWTWWHTHGRFDVVHSHENVFHGNVHTVHVKPMRINLLAGVTGIRRAMRQITSWISLRLLAYRWMEHLRLEGDPKRILIATSQPLRDDLLRHFKVVSEQVHYLPPGVVIPEIPSLAHRLELRHQARQTLGLSVNASLMLMVGHDFRKKGLGVCLRALAKLPDPWQLVVVGNPQQIQQWQSLIDSEGVAHRVHFLGVLKETALVYEACDVMVHATLEDVFGMVALEAMAFGLPLIISPAPYCQGATLLTHEEQAMVLPHPEDDDAVSTFIMKIESDDRLRQRLAIQGRAFCKSFGWEKLSVQQESLYWRAVQERT